MNDGLLKSILVIIGAITLAVFAIRVVGSILAFLIPPAIVIIAIYIVYRLITGNKNR
ncbi:hypothetical protein RBH29_06990 [Herbivorax sp. ANBcel31]|uniref:hypothetical protein n=1 Tax=Herbivorax sp. ANBcel31 TaxID=3069754 RepID=UPI0027B12495|nr:hypothetical protein [Herbivorax sp. ANBcel31]MDQ2086175.1 hypothetical protein [Herbivorax sp. ANBcel31]